MYKKPIYKKTSLRVNESSEGETLEMKIDRFVNNREPLQEKGVQPIYMERKEGINRAYDVKTDRFEVAIEAMDKVAKSITARREEKAKMEIVKDDNKNENVG